MAKSPDVSYPSLDIPATVYPSQDTRVLPRQVFTSGTLPGNTVIRIGNANITIDGANKRILVSDGTNDRVLIGYQENGF